jgi:pyruvate-formate lyase-activating enzyme
VAGAECELKRQGYESGSCSVEARGKKLPACQATLREHDGALQRLIHAVHLSRPENYLSIYQTGCNMSCRKCHSWEFSQVAAGEWMTPRQIAEQGVVYERHVTLKEPREKATAWHAQDTCRCCGSCVLSAARSARCPGILPPEAITFSPQGFGPARNIVAFTGGDVTCRPEFYAECARFIKAGTALWVLIETNGYGLTSQNLDVLRDAGVDGFWLDIKAHDAQTHEWLTGCGNDRIRKLPAEILERGFVLEVLSLCIPGVVGPDQLERIAAELAAVDLSIPFTILAFFPAYQMKGYRSPTVVDMVDAYQRAKKSGLRNVRLGNVGVFAHTEADWSHLKAHVGPDAY